MSRPTSAPIFFTVASAAAAAVRVVTKATAAGRSTEPDERAPPRQKSKAQHSSARDNQGQGSVLAEAYAMKIGITVLGIIDCNETMEECLSDSKKRYQILVFVLGCRECKNGGQPRAKFSAF